MDSTGFAETHADPATSRNHPLDEHNWTALYICIGGVILVAFQLAFLALKLHSDHRVPRAVLVFAISSR